MIPHEAILKARKHNEMKPFWRWLYAQSEDYATQDRRDTIDSLQRPPQCSQRREFHIQPPSSARPWAIAASWYVRTKPGHSAIWTTQSLLSVDGLRRRTEQLTTLAGFGLKLCYNQPSYKND